MYRCTNPEVVTWCSHYLRRPFGLRLLNHNNRVSSEWNQARSARRYYQFWLVDCMHGHSGNRTDDVCLPSTLKDWAPDCQKGAECPASDNSEKSIRSFGDWKANSPKIPSMFLLWVNLGKLACIWLTWCEGVQTCQCHCNAITIFVGLFFHCLPAKSQTISPASKDPRHLRESPNVWRGFCC